MGFVIVSLYQFELLNGRDPTQNHQRDNLDEHPRYQGSWQMREVREDEEGLRPLLSR